MSFEQERYSFMELENLKESALQGQTKIQEKRDISASKTELMEPYTALCVRLEGVKSYFVELCNEYAGLGTDYNKSHIRLAAVDSTVAENQKRLPAGYVEVSITHPVRNPGSMYDRVKKESDVFELIFSFVPKDPQKEKERAILEDMTERTVHKSKDDLPKSAKDNPDRKKGVVTPAIIISSEDLELYQKSYLPTREKEIEDLEKTIAQIKKVIDDPKLNEWAVSEKESKLAELEKREQLIRDEARITTESANKHADEWLRNQSQQEPTSRVKRFLGKISDL
jgi:hypothetical protein